MFGKARTPRGGGWKDRRLHFNICESTNDFQDAVKVQDQLSVEMLKFIHIR